MALFRVGALPDEAVAAAARFHAEVLPKVQAELAASPAALTLVFAPADYTHRGWRLSVVQGLAREHAPLRVNGVESINETGESEEAIAAAARYLDAAQGVTGQLLQLDGKGAGEVLSNQA